MLNGGISHYEDMPGNVKPTFERTTKDKPSTTQPLEPSSIPPQLANTLEQIVGQLDVLTQVSTWLRSIGQNILDRS